MPHLRPKVKWIEDLYCKKSNNYGREDGWDQPIKPEKETPDIQRKAELQWLLEEGGDQTNRHFSAALLQDRTQTLHSCLPKRLE
jgi:hypothetical protein